MTTISESGAETVEHVPNMIRDVPDRLASAERELQRLCQWGVGSVSLEAKVMLVSRGLGVCQSGGPTQIGEQRVRQFLPGRDVRGAQQRRRMIGRNHRGAVG